MAKKTNPFNALTVKGGKLNNLSISWDYESDPDDKSQRVPSLLVTPNRKKFEHYHIDLNRKQAKKLKNWLTWFLNNN